MHSTSYYVRMSRGFVICGYLSCYYCFYIFGLELSVQLHQKIVRLGENYIDAGLRELHPQSTAQSPQSPQSPQYSLSPRPSPLSAADTYHVVVTTSTAVVFWATAVKSEAGLCIVHVLSMFICTVFVCVCVCVRACM